MTKKLIIIALSVVLAVIGAAIGAYFFFTRPVKIYSQKVNANTFELNLEGENIASLDELLDKLSPFLFLKKLDLGDFKVFDADADRLSKELPGVEIKCDRYIMLYGDYVRINSLSLDLSNKNITDIGELTTALKMFNSITDVDLYGNGFSKEQQEQLIDAFPGVAFGFDVSLLGKTYNSKTEDLDLSGNTKVTPDLMREYVKFFPNLKRLDMSDCGATNEEMAKLREDLPGIKVVWRVHLGRWSLKTDAVAFSVLIYTYDYDRMTTEDIQVLKYCTDLQALDLGHQAITDISVLGDYLPQLRILILADNRVSDLSPIAKMKHLHYLELFVNSRQLTDLSPIAACKELVDVNVSYLHNVRDISALYDLPLLERIWFEHTPIPAAQVNTLREKHPDARIVTEGTGSIDQGWRTHERYHAMIGMFHDKNCKVLSESFSKYDNK